MKGCLHGTDTHEKVFSEADTGDRMFGYSKQVKESLIKEYKEDPTDRERRALSLGLVGSTVLFFPNDPPVYGHLI